MKLRKLLCLLLLLAVPMSAAAADVDSGGVYCFGAQEFGENLEGVCLRQVPSFRHASSGKPGAAAGGCAYPGAAGCRHLYAGTDGRRRCGDLFLSGH